MARLLVIQVMENRRYYSNVDRSHSGNVRGLKLLGEELAPSAKLLPSALYIGRIGFEAEELYRREIA